MIVSLIPILETNYVFCIQNTDQYKKECILVDPGASSQVIDFLNANQLTPAAILLTHHHSDHVDGVDDLVRRYSCDVYGYAQDLPRLPNVSRPVQDGDFFSLLGIEFKVKFVPGHTSGHILYAIPDYKACFVGDTLFSMGCGRVFDGTMEQLFQSLDYIRRMDAETQMYCAHEYTLDNLKFAKSIDPSTELKKAEKLIIAMRDRDLPSIPFELGQQLELNPFLALFNLSYREKIGLSHLSELECFKQLRLAKDTF